MGRNFGRKKSGGKHGGKKSSKGSAKGTDTTDGSSVKNGSKDKTAKENTDAEISNELCVSNIPYEATEDELRTELLKFAYPIIDLKLLTDPKTGRGKGSACVTLERGEDAMSLLYCSGPKPCLRERVLTIRPNKKTKSDMAIVSAPRPWDEDYVKIGPTDLEFDLEPADVSLPCIHCLSEDVMLKIFSYLKFEELIRLEIVCRWWQNLVYRSVKSLFEAEPEEYMDIVRTQIYHFRSNRTIQSFIMAKLFQILGPNIDTLETDYFWMYNTKRLISLAIKFCSNIQRLYFNAMYPNSSEVNLLLKKFPTITKVHMCQGAYTARQNTFCTVPIPVLTKRQTNLTELFFYNVGSFSGEEFQYAPQSLKRLEVLLCSKFDVANVKRLYKRCRLLEVLVIDGDMSSAITSDVEKLSDLREMGFRGSTECKGRFEIFKKIITLQILNILDDSKHFNGYFEVFPNVVNLFMSKSVEHGETGLIYSRFKKIKRVSLPHMPRAHIHPCLSVGTLADCVDLETVSFHMSDYYPTPEFLDGLREIVENCHKLNEIVVIGALDELEDTLVQAMVSGRRPETASKVKIISNHLLDSYLSAEERSVLVEQRKRLTDAGYMIEGRSYSALNKGVGERGDYFVESLEPEEEGLYSSADSDPLEYLEGGNDDQMSTLANRCGIGSLPREEQEVLLYACMYMYLDIKTALMCIYSAFMTFIVDLILRITLSISMDIYP